MKNLNFQIDYYKVDSLALSVKDLQGSFLQKCTALLPESDRSDQNELLLSNILKAINLDIKQDIHLGYLAEENTYQLVEYLVEEGPNLILVFGIKPEFISLHLDHIYYAPLQVSSSTWIFSHSLSELSDNKSLKKNLWGALKEIKAAGLI